MRRIAFGLREKPLSWTVSPGAKFVPVIVAWILGHPTIGCVARLIPWITGIGNGVTLSTLAAVEPPPGARFVTVSLPVPPFMRSAAERATLSDVVPRKAVGLAEPFHSTTEVASKPEPVRVIVAALPVATVRGKIEVRTGVGWTIGRSNGTETPPPGAGFVSVTEAMAPAASEMAGTVALNSVELMNFAVRILSFQSTTVVGRKLFPTISSEMDGLPAGMLAGEIDVITGRGFTILICWAEEVPPPGVEFVTVTAEFAMAARSAAVRDRVSWVALVNAVGLALPLILAVEVGTKPLPNSITLALDAPAAITEGATLRSTGVGLLTLRVAAVLALVLVPSVTATRSCVPDTNWLAGTVACSWVEPT
jgi:hypothetical protein